MTISYEWRIYCETEGAQKVIISNGDISNVPAPRCPTDANHTVTEGSLWFNNYKLTKDRVIVLSDKRVSGTSGGTTSSGNWFQRTLNTIEGPDQTFCTLTANNFILSSGKYTVEGSVPGFNCGTYQARIVDSLSNVLVYGTCEYNASNSVQTRSFFKYTFEITSETTFALQQKVGTTNATNGGGRSTGFGIAGQITEVYSVIHITKHGV